MRWGRDGEGEDGGHVIYCIILSENFKILEIIIKILGISIKIEQKLLRCNIKEESKTEF